MRRSALVFGLCLIALRMLACQYWYPVAASDHSILYLYQKNLTELELWSLDIVVGRWNMALPSGMLPACVSVIPNRGFSFLDQNILKFKSFIKRSPGIIELERPLRLMSKVTWIDQENGYLTALFGKHLGIFIISVDGQVRGVVAEEYDACFPFLVDNMLFFVARKIVSQSFLYEIIQGTVEKFDFQYCSTIFINKNPLVFLKMHSAQDGFFVEENGVLNDSIQYSFYYFKQSKPYWKSELLFQFCIPNSLIIGNKSDRVYESIFPFLPTIHDNLIYFCSAQNSLDSTVNIFTFNLMNKQIHQLTHAQTHQHHFAPFIHNDVLYYGSSCQQSVG